MGEIKIVSLVIFTLFVLTITTNADHRVISCESYETKTCFMNNQTVIDGPDFTIEHQEENVKWLQFENNKGISFLPVEIYKSFTNLTLLGAASCSLKNVSKNNFKQLYTCKLLYLQDNQIQMIHSDTFSDLFSLKYLNLGGNGILFMNGDSVVWLTRLTNFITGPKDCFNKEKRVELFKFDLASLQPNITERCGFDETEYLEQLYKPTEQEKLERQDLFMLFVAESKKKERKVTHRIRSK